MNLGSRVGAAALAVLAVGAATARAAPTPAPPTVSGPLDRIAAVNDAPCEFEASSTVCRWAFALDAAAGADPAQDWFAMVSAASYVPPRGSCLISLRLTAEYDVPPGSTGSLVPRTTPRTTALHADRGGRSTLSLAVDANGTAVTPGGVALRVHDEPGAVSKWMETRKQPGGLPGKVLDVVTEWSGRTAAAVQLATAEEQASNDGLVVASVRLLPVIRPGSCAFIPPAGPGFYAAPAQGAAPSSVSNCILVRAPQPARVAWSVSGPGFRSGVSRAALPAVAGYGRACVPIGSLPPGRYVAHVTLRGGRATRRYNVPVGVL